MYSLDESLNDVTQTCEMDLYVHFWDSVSNRVETRFFDSSFLGHKTQQDLCILFIDVTKDLNSTRLSQISIYRPSVNITFYSEFIKKTGRGMLSLVDRSGQLQPSYHPWCPAHWGDKVWMGLKKHPQRSLSNITWLTYKNGRLWWVCDFFNDISFQLLLNSVSVWFM